MRKCFIVFTLCIVILCFLLKIERSHPFLSLSSADIESISIDCIWLPSERILTPEQQVRCVEMLQGITLRNEINSVVFGIRFDFGITLNTGEFVSFSDYGRFCMMNGVTYKAEHDYDVFEFFEEFFPRYAVRVEDYTI